jgi:hypothetical protein
VKPLGAPCSNTDLCGGRHACIEATCQMPRSAAPMGRFPAGAECSVGRGCDDEYVCRAVDPAKPQLETCVPLVSTIGIGQLCNGVACAPDAYCDQMGYCRAAPVLGQACATDTRAGSRGCVMDAQCIDGLCAARFGLGERCNTGLCMEGLECGNRTPQGLTTCIREVEEGDRCAEPLEPCAQGTECRDGKCVAVDSIGAFARLCGP